MCDEILLSAVILRLLPAGMWWVNDDDGKFDDDDDMDGV